MSDRAAPATASTGAELLAANDVHKTYRLGRVEVPVLKGSSAITTLASADGFVEIDEDTEVVERGERVDVRLFD